MLDTGNFVLYNSQRDVVWQSFSHPTDTILPGQTLYEGRELKSHASETDYSTGIFYLVMQIDGYLVQYPLDGPYIQYNAYGAWGKGENITLNLDDDGRLYILNESGIITYNLSQGETTKDKNIYMLKLDVDGILRVYSHSLDDPKSNWSISWKSSDNKCDPKGLCGLNAYCVLMDVEAECKCLPGFDFVQPGNWSSGCGRNLSVEGCKNANYTMETLDNTIWENISYSVIQQSTSEDCQEACLLDCNCEVATFQDSQCRMQRLPLRYGRRLVGDSAVTFIKLSEAVMSNKPPGKEGRIKLLLVGAFLTGFALIVLIGSGVLVYRNHVWAYTRINENAKVEIAMDVGLRVFTFKDLEQVTNGFREELGKGAFGTVYKGIIPYNQKVVGVKRLDKPLSEGETEFQTEMRVIGRTHHINLVRLIGYCLDGSNRILVYEYMSGGSLAHVLYSSENRPNWEERIRIARDIAKGILYLHEECETQIIHCDIKPGNILMDDHGCAKISDFGLAKLLRKDQTKTYTGVRGTRGYVAPEWHRKLPITVKADVYSFGIVLLEIICCRRCLDWNLSEEEAVLEDWVYNCFEANELGKLVGDEEVDMNKLERFVKVALWCIQDEPSLRPSMRKVLLMMEGTIGIPVPPNPASFLSAI